MPVLIETATAFIQANYFWIFCLVTAIAGFTVWVQNVYTIKKLHLEIESLMAIAKKRKIEEEEQKVEDAKRESPIVIATLEEIIKFADTKPSPKELRKFLQDKEDSLLTHLSGAEVGSGLLNKTAIALSSIENKLFPFALLKFVVAHIIAILFVEIFLVLINTLHIIMLKR